MEGRFLTMAVGDIREAIHEVFEKNFRERGEIGAAVSVWQQGREVASLVRGHRDRERTVEWSADTLVPVWSSTKGPAALACLLALDEGRLTPDVPVAEVWPRFARSGKERITFGQVLSHAAGLFALDRGVSILDHAAVVEALEEQAPAPGAAERPAYHARTFGFLLDEIVRRITGAGTLGGYFFEKIARPLGMDFWIGLPEREFPRVARLYPGRMGPDAMQDPFIRAIGTRGSATQRAFLSPTGLTAIHDMNQSATWELGLPGMGGVGSARGLAQFYALLANDGCWEGSRLVPGWCLDALSRTLIQGEDEVLCAETAFGAGVMRDPVDAAGVKKRRFFGSSRAAFGHPGAGGSLAFADPERGLSFAYVMNQMEPGALPGPRTLDLVEALEAAW